MPLKINLLKFYANFSKRPTREEFDRVKTELERERSWFFKFSNSKDFLAGSLNSIKLSVAEYSLREIGDYQNLTYTIRYGIKVEKGGFFGNGKETTLTYITDNNDEISRKEFRLIVRGIYEYYRNKIG